MRHILTCFLCISLNVAAENCVLLSNIQGQSEGSKTRDNQEFTWMAFDQKQILTTSVDGTLQDYAHCQARDGRGKHVLPGMIDAHAHVADLGTEMMRVRLRDIRSEAKAVEAVAAFANEYPQAKWILGRGWNQVLWDNNQFPQKSSLDKSGVEKPILLRRVDVHAAWVNSRALALAGINAETPDPDGGKIIRDEQGEATGVLLDTAMELVENIIPPDDAETLSLAFAKSFEHLLSVGIVGVHDAGIGAMERQYYENAAKNHEMPLRIYAMLSASAPELEQWLARGHYQDADGYLSIRSVKIYADGALGSRGAAMLKPYSDDPDNSGLLITGEADLNAVVELVLKHDFQANVHAIGDRANFLALNAYEKAYSKVGGRHLRNRIEHAQIIAVADIPRFKSLDIVASMQPVHATSDMNMAGDRVGDARLAGAYAWQSLLQQGTVIASGSDFPVELANPFHGLYAAITRQDQQQQPEGGWLPEQRMSTQQALRSFTVDAAYAAHQEGQTGSLQSGQWADFILVDRDITTSEQLWDTQVLETWVGGQLRYVRPAKTWNCRVQ